MPPMTRPFRLPSAMPHDPAIDAWFAADDELRRMARPWFERMRACGPDVRELLHDGYPTACVGDAAFAHVAAYKAHANVAFFNGVALPDPACLLEGTGKRMRHVKLRWGQPADTPAVEALITAAYEDMRRHP